MTRNKFEIDFTNLAVLASLPSHVLEALKSIATLYALQAGEPLFQQGDFSHAFYIVQEGGVRLVEHTDNGQDVNLKVYGPGDLFGLLAISGAYPHPARIEAAIDSLIIGISGQQARQLILEHPELGVLFIDLLVDHVHHAHERIRHMAAERTEQRLARAILHFSDKFGVELDGGPSEIALSQQDIAEFTGTTLETVNRLLRRWSKAGLIALQRRQINILDRSALQALANAMAEPGMGRVLE